MIKIAIFCSQLVFFSTIFGGYLFYCFVNQLELKKFWEKIFWTLLSRQAEFEKVSDLKTQK